MTDSDTAKDASEDRQCVVCGSDSHDGEGWIIPTGDTKIVDLTPDGPERELRDEYRTICSLECRDEFEKQEVEGDA